tara:strand:- start:644 stop:817 length:174 start_codon:yes stop_codon:yes gene_type:complete
LENFFHDLILLLLLINEIKVSKKNYLGARKKLLDQHKKFFFNNEETFYMSDIIFVYQ